MTVIHRNKNQTTNGNFKNPTFSISMPQNTHDQTPTNIISSKSKSMGCVSSKLFKHELNEEILLNNGDEKYINHVVSLTSSTYGVLNLESEKQSGIQIDEIVDQIKKKSSPMSDGLEVINSWELMEGLELDEVENQQMGFSKATVTAAAELRKSPKVSNFVRGIDSISPMRFFSPRKGKKFGSGKENKTEIYTTGGSVNKLKKLSPNLKILTERNWIDPKSDRSSRRKSLSPLFDPELLEFLEKDLTDKENEFNKTFNSIAPIQSSIKNSNTAVAAARLESFIEKSPPGGENSIILYTTTLRGIRKTFEDCNIVRSIIESHNVQIIERDVSMDSGFKEELRKVMNTKEIKVPILFIKGRMIGGAEIVSKMDEEGSLYYLLEGVPKAAAGLGGGGCVGCGGVRFVMCGMCDGSSKVLDDKGRKSLKCLECNENGLIHCPVCS